LLLVLDKLLSSAPKGQCCILYCTAEVCRTFGQYPAAAEQQQQQQADLTAGD
jgi:NADH:ubiquinone oxidoreductase subunit E